MSSTTTGVKVCRHCKQALSTDCFNKNKAALDGLQAYCTTCSNRISRKHYKDNIEIYRQKDKAKRTASRLLVDNIKETVGCAFCSECNPVCLDFHHEYPEDKVLSISSSMKCPTHRILEEIKKCIVVCANCHRKLHSREVDDCGIVYR